MNKPTFHGSVLKAIVCTPSKGSDGDAYQRVVVEPTRRLRALWEKLGVERPTDDQIREALGILKAIFELKQVDLAERNERLHEIAELHSVPDHLMS